MRAKLAGLVAVLAHIAIELQAPQIADACGVKLTVKPSAPRKAVARTANPSPVLLVGSPPKRLERDLKQAGHKVDRAPDTQSATGTSYAVVVVDSEDQARAARERYATAAVIVRSGDVRVDLASLEDRVARRPTAVATARTAVAARTDRQPVAAGPQQRPKEVVTAKTVEATPVAAAEPAPTPAPTPAPAPTPPPPARVTAAQPKAETKAKPEAKEVAPAALHQEVFFGLGSAKVGNAKALARAVTWLNTNASASLTLEGHADPTGTPDGNMALSQARAEAVRDFLVGKGIDASRIEVKALGDTQLKYGRTDGRNRRVAIDATP